MVGWRGKSASPEKIEDLFDQLLGNKLAPI
jgi:hypothetical protein